MVSIIITTKNSEDFIANCINAAKNSNLCVDLREYND